MLIEYKHLCADTTFLQALAADDWDTLESWLSYFRRNNRIVKSITDNRGRTINIKQES